MNLKALMVVAGAALSFASPAAVSALPSGTVLLPDSRVFRVTSAGVTYTCGELPPWTVGRMVSGRFYPVDREIRNLSAKLRAARTSAEKRKLANQIAGRRTYKAAGTPLCLNGPPASGAKFDAQGNVTQAGKAAFGIPLSLDANVNRGIAAWNQDCRGCHNSYPSNLSIKTYPLISQRIQLSPMFFSIPSEVTEQQIADIVAFTNFIGSMTRETFHLE